MEKTQELLDLEFKSYLGFPCGIAEYEAAVISNPNYLPDEYDHLVKYSAIPKEIIDEWLNDLAELSKPLDEEVYNSTEPSKGLIYMVMHPEYQEEWQRNMDVHSKIRKEQEPKRLAIHKKLHHKYFYEYGIKFTPNHYR